MRENIRNCLVFLIFLTSSVLIACGSGKGGADEAIVDDANDVAEAFQDAVETEAADISGEEVSDGLPQSLPFELKRAD
ncbi:MAG: hypothetical protein FJ088_15655, partial [Deltaproteobacteria bacterium]|nr:hypothetical protein [Deltaproteobacteria bacterium]